MKVIDRHNKYRRLSFVVQTVAALLLLGLLASGQLRGISVWLNISVVVITIALWGNGILRQRMQSKMDVSVITKQELLSVLSKYRHEVLNQVQLIKAYIQLGKQERVASALASLVEAAREHSELANLWNPIVSYSAISAKLDYPGVKIEIRTQLNDQFPFQQRDNEQLLAIKEQMPALSDEASHHLGVILYEIRALAQELQEDTSADIQWLLLLIPEGSGVRVKIMLLGEAVTEAFCQEIEIWLGEKGLILLTIASDKLDEPTVENRVEINARLVSLTGEPIWVSQSIKGR